MDAFRRQGSLATRDICRILDTDDRTARRTVLALQEANVPIHQTGEGIDRRWVVERSWQETGQMTPLGDMLALHLGRQLFAFVGDVSAWYDELLGRLEPSVSEQIAQRHARIAERVVYLSEPYREYRTGDEDVLNEVLTGLLYDRQLDLAYAAANQHHDWRGVLPLALVVYRRALYLLAQLQPGGRVLRLALDRVRSATCTRETFAYPRGFDPNAALRDTFGIFDDGRGPERVRMRFSPEVATVVASRRWHPSAAIDIDPDGYAILTMFAGGRELTRLALEFGDKVEVLEPAWLRDEVVNELTEALRLYLR